MNKTVLIWMLLCMFLTLKSFQRPSYAVGVYMLTFFAHPLFWWWGDILEGIRWNFFAGILLLGTLVATNASNPMTRERPLETNAVKILALLALNAILVHALLAVNPEASLGWLTNKLKFILLFFLLQYAIRDQKDYRIVVMSIVLGMGYIGYEATINERGSFSGGRLEGVGAAGIQSSNQLASLLITGLLIGSTYLLTKAPTWSKGVVIVACALTFNVVLMCNSRGAFLGLLVGGVVAMAMATGPARKKSLKLAGLAVVGTFLLLGDPEIARRFLTTFDPEGPQDNSAQSRIVFWTAASGQLRDYPLGSGGNSFSEGRGWRYMRGDRTVPTDTRAIHNGFLTEATDWGIQGFLLKLLFLAAVFKTCFRGRRLAIKAGDGEASMVYGCLAGALVAWMVSSVFGDYLNEEWGFWVAALAYSYLRVHTLAPAQEEAKTAPAVVSQFAPAMPGGRSL